MKHLQITLATMMLGCLWAAWPAAAIGQLPVAPPAKSFEEKAAGLLDRYVEVTGGQAAYDAIKTRVIQGELAGKGRGMAGTMQTYFAPGGLFYSEIHTRAGIHRRGSNGNTVWKIEPQYDQAAADLTAVTPTYDARIARGLERVLVLRDGTLDRFAHWRTLARQVQYAGEAAVGEKPCAKVVLTYEPIDPDVQEEPVVIYLELDSGLIARYDTAISRPDQFIKVSAILDSYKKVDDVLLPHKLTVTTNDVEQYTVRLISVQNNAVIAAQRFELPPAIQKLLVSGQ